jgi:hypothetical protein
MKKNASLANVFELPSPFFFNRPLQRYVFFSILQTLRSSFWPVFNRFAKNHGMKAEKILLQGPFSPRVFSQRRQK